MHLEAIHANVRSVQIDSKTAVEIATAEFSQCGHHLFLLSKNGAPSVHQLNTGELKECPLNYNIMRSVHGSFHPEWAEIAMTSRDENLVQRFFIGLRETPAARHPVNRPLCAAYSPCSFNPAANEQVSGRYLIVGTESGLVRVWDLQSDPSPALIWDETIIDGAITRIGFSARNDMFFGLVRSKGPFLLDTYGQFTWLPNENSWGNNDWNCNAIACHPEYNFFAYSGRGSLVHTYDWLSSKHSCMVTGLPSIEQIKFAGSEQIVLVGTNSLEVWHAKGYGRICRWDAPSGRILAVHASEMQLTVACT